MNRIWLRGAGSRVWDIRYGATLGVCMKRNVFKPVRGVGCARHIHGLGLRRWARPTLRLLSLCLLCGPLILSGCRTAAEHREEADNVAAEIITQKQGEALGRTEPFSVERPSDILRRRLLLEQDLPYSSKASLGTDELETIEYWPEPNYPYATYSTDANVPIEPNQSVRLSLIDALQVGARNSSEYQKSKEDVFGAALALDLQRNTFRNIFFGQGESTVSSDAGGDTTTNTASNSGSAGLSRTFENGLALSGALALDLVNLLRPNWASSAGLVGDVSLTLPLLRGAGRRIVREPLTQAERDVIYAIWDFERFKRTFAVSVASQYLSVLQQVEEVKNADDDYGRAIRTARRSRRLAEAGRLSQVELDQAVQDELRSRNSWISARERLKGSLDAFKRAIGLPTDALIELDRRDLEQLTDRADEVVNELIAQQEDAESEATPPADAPVVLEPATREGAGPFELQESVAIDLAWKNRLDLRVADGEVYDAQRQVVVRADALRSALGVGATAASGRGEDDLLRFDNGSYSASLLLDLPLERTAERNAYRQSLISFERATRNVQTLEDQIKLSIRDELRALLESRETVNIQALAVVLAEKRVTMSNLFLEAGRAQIRDVLEAQQALLSARNSLTAAVVSYRVAELELQRDTGVLQVDESGLWQEFKPEEIGHGEAK